MLTSDVGNPKLKDHFRDVLVLMRAARNWKEFYFLLDRSLPRFTDTLQLPFDDTQAMEALPMKQIEPLLKMKEAANEALNASLHREREA
jgi:hypothetical protein